MDYNFRETERKWQEYWSREQVFKAENKSDKPKYYVLDMFPYPSGAGLHVGHPLGYIASDIIARYKRLQGFNVLHPMGYDAYGLPAEQYAIQTGTHPAVTTEKNIKRYRKQLDQLGFSFDWSREVKTCDPSYYKWTQWTFIRLFHHWYNTDTDKAEPIENLISVFKQEGNQDVYAVQDEVSVFSASEWKSMAEKEQQEVLMKYRLAYLSDTWVNWCPALGTVLANDEVKEGYSERGGHPVEKKLMKQWALRITAYAQRLLDGLEEIDWSESVKEMQRNWIGRSEGASVWFNVKDHDEKIEVFTTRPDTLYGAMFMVLAPEHELVRKIMHPSHKEEVEAYIDRSSKRTERERMAETKMISGVFTGAYGINPLNGEFMPVWIADYVLAGYGTGAIMAVPGHDSRDFAFARHFKIPIRQVVLEHGKNESEPTGWKDAYEAKEGIMINSGFMNGMPVKEAICKCILKLEKDGFGKGMVNYRLHDAIFSRQRYWGEPFPVYYKEGMPFTLNESELPLALPEVDKYLPTEKGEPPLARAQNWKTQQGYPLETNTMPGFAGSSGYYLRYMDPWNDKEYFSKEANEYWRDVDLYIGGDEHATGHLLYARFWSHFLYDMGLVCEKEPFKKLINQGKIQGCSNFVYRVRSENKFVSYNLRMDYSTTRLHVDIGLVKDDVLDIEAFKNWREEFKDAEFVLEEGKYICGSEIEKMSKSKHNVQNPDELVEKYGSDTLRLYEMFLGPIEQHKPWDTKGIEGVYRFLMKFWRLFFRDGRFELSDENPNDKENKVLHQTIKKVRDDIDRYSFNTVVSAFMICANDLTELKCNKRKILEPLVVLLSPYAPHMAEELWALSGYKESVSFAHLPNYKEELLVEDQIDYPVTFNGKLRFKMSFPSDMKPDEIRSKVEESEEASKWLAGKSPRKIIVVPGRIINVVV